MNEHQALEIADALIAQERARHAQQMQALVARVPLCLRTPALMALPPLQRLAAVREGRRIVRRRWWPRFVPCVVLLAAGAWLSINARGEFLQLMVPIAALALSRAANELLVRRVAQAIAEARCG